MQYLMHSKIVELKERMFGEEGATAVEYGVMVALIIAVVVGIVATLGESVNSAFTSVDNSLNATT